ncbi:MAG TPA: DUF2339 domain-containing protein [Pyrinomonadaceae bacterium]|nr:DUF2339 domain-containing protein [Pyrinomonadaceae bacterium]
MDQLLITIFILIVALLVGAIVMPVIALVFSIQAKRQLKDYRHRLALVETSLASQISHPRERLDQLATEGPAPTADQTAEKKEPPTIVIAPPPTPSTEAEPLPSVAQATPPAAEARPVRTDELESMIGRRWLGWAAVGLILFAAAFFLKYAFDNRWIGELGRVAIGIFCGIAMSLLGFRYHQRKWRVFSQILTAGGIVLLYVSAYAAFGYYRLVPQNVSFVFLAVLIAEAAGLALLYNAPAIAIMALVGGFLTPLLLHSERDQYRALFAYIAALDIGALALLKHWPGLSSLAFFGTHLLFWLWYNERYHPRKLLDVLVFQVVVFLLFLLAHLGKQIFRRIPSTWEDLSLVVVNPFVFFATAYHLLNPEHHDWMGAFAIGMALLYAGSAKILLDQRPTSRSELLILVAVALTFVTIAIPIQLRSNWITIAWAVEALVMLWVSMETQSSRLRLLAAALFILSIGRLLFWDTPFVYRPTFTPILNRYFLSSVFVIGCLFAAAALYERAAKRRQLSAPKLKLVIVLIAVTMLWFVASVETHTFFEAKAASEILTEEANRQSWLGQMALSVVWAVFAAVLAAVGFIRRSPGLRWAALVLFALTVVKAMLVDIASLQQLYRIIVFFVLGVLLLLVAWGYHKAFYSKEAST